MNDHGEPAVVPGISRLKLKPDAIEHLRIPAEGLERVRDDSDKRGVPIDMRRADRPVPAKRIYVLMTGDRDDIAIIPVAGAQKVRALRKHAFRFRFVEGLGLTPHYFRQVLGLAARIPIAAVTYPKAPRLVSDVVDRIITDARGRT